jgi:hypothetical protein
MMVTSLHKSLTSTVPRVFLSRQAVLLGRTDLVGRGGRVAEGVVAVVVGQAVWVPVLLRAAVIGKLQDVQKDRAFCAVFLSLG